MASLSILNKISLMFAAGCLGGLLNSLAVWGCGTLEVTQALHVMIAPALTAAWLYPRIVWGGIWGLLFLLPIIQPSWWLQGLALSLGPSLAQLFIVFPVKTDHGLLGLGLGSLTPLLVLGFNAIWGLGASWWLTQVAHGTVQVQRSGP